MNFCKECGQPVLDGAKFCENCGARLIDETAAQPSAEEPVPDSRAVTQEPVAPAAPVVTKPASVPSTNGFGIASLVFGVFSVIGLFFVIHPAYAIVNLIFAILAIVFGAVGLKRAKQNQSSGGLAIAGLICGIVAAAFSGLSILCWGSCAAVAWSGKNAIDSISQF